MPRSATTSSPTASAAGGKTCATLGAAKVTVRSARTCGPRRGAAAGEAARQVDRHPRPGRRVERGDQRREEPFERPRQAGAEEGVDHQVGRRGDGEGGASSPSAHLDERQLEAAADRELHRGVAAELPAAGRQDDLDLVAAHVQVARHGQAVAAVVARAAEDDRRPPPGKTSPIASTTPIAAFSISTRPGMPSSSMAARSTSRIASAVRTLISGHPPLATATEPDASIRETSGRGEPPRGLGTLTEQIPGGEQAARARAAEVAGGHRRGEPAQVGGRVDVGGARQQLDGEAQLAAALEGRGEHPGGAPGDPGEEARVEGAGAQGDQVVAAVFGRTEHHFGAGFQALEGAMDEVQGQGGMVAAQRGDEGGLAGGLGKGAVEPLAQVVAFLAQAGDGAGGDRLAGVEGPG